MAAAGAAAGGTVGGAVIYGFGWPWIFLINVPVGVGALLASQRVLPPDHRPVQSGSVQGGSVQGGSVGGRPGGPLAGARQLDLPGALVGTVALLLLGYGIGAVAETGTAAVAVLALGVVMLTGFVILQARVARPLMPLRLFRVRNVSASALTNVWAGAAHVPAFLLLALYFQQVWHYTPVVAGLATLPIALINIAVSRLLIPPAMHRHGPRTVVVVGMLLQAAALAWFARTPADGSYLVDVLPACVVFAIGLPAAMVGVTVPAMKSVPDRDTGIVGGVVNTAQRVGSGLGASTVTAVVAAWATSNPDSPAAGLIGGLQAAFLAAAAFALIGALTAALAFAPQTAPAQPAPAQTAPAQTARGESGATT